MTDTSILGVIKHYQRSIERCQDDEERLLYCIKKLYKLPVKVEHLQETGIGKTVNSLRKFNGEIGVASKTLVTKWKAMVAAEEEPVEINCQINEDINNAYTRKETSDEDDDDHVSNSRVNNNNINNTIPTKKVSNQVYSKKPSPESASEKERQKSSGNNDCMESSFSHIENLSGNSERSTSDYKKTPEVLEKHSKSREKLHEQNKATKERRTQDESDKTKKSDEKRKEKESGRHKVSHHKSSRHSASVTKGEGSDFIHISKEKSEHSHEKRREHAKANNSSSASTSSKDKDGHSHKKSKDVKSIEKNEIHRDKVTSSSKSPLSSTTDKASTSSDRKRARENYKNSDELKSPNAKVVKVQKTAKLKINNDEGNADDGIDSSMGANFADVLGMLNMPTKKTKKHQSTPNNTPTIKSGNSNDFASCSNSKINGCKISLPYSSSKNTNYVASRIPDTKPDLLSSTAKLEPLDPSIALELPMISNNYRPLPYNPSVMDCVFKPEHKQAPSARTLTDAEALSHGISSKTMRTKIYSGVKTGQIHQVPSLFGLCIRVLQKNIDALEYTGGVPFEILRRVLERASPHQLLTFEEFNPYLMEDSDTLWKIHVQRNYRTQQREEMESWREMFLRCQENEERKLNSLAETIKQSQKIIAAPVRKTQMAFVDTMVKPPRNVVRKQEQYGTKSKLIATPAARVAALSSVIPNATKTGDVRLRVGANVRDAAQAQALVRPKKAPLMAKTLQLMRGRHKR